jgi:uncharacterized protein
VVFRFYVTVVSFHLLLGSACSVAVAAWRRRGSAFPLARLLRAGVGLVALAVILAAACSLIGPRSGFLILRLLSQALFGEAPLLLVWLCWRAWQLRRKRLALGFGSMLAGLLAVYVDAYHLEPTALRLERHVLAVGQGGHGRLRVVHLSDLQAHKIGPHERRSLALAFDLAPDIVILTGDYVQPRLAPTRRQTAADLRAILRQHSMRARYGVFAVRGDVDVDWPDVLAGTGVRLLSGETVRIALPGRALSLIGLTPGMSRAHDNDDLLRLVRSVPPGDLRVVAGHNPNFVDVLAGAEPVDLALAGHTHGGQVVLPLIGAPYTKTRLPNRFAGGLHDYGGVPLHVSRGIGMERGTAPQVRFRCPPEVCLLAVSY